MFSRKSGLIALSLAVVGVVGLAGFARGGGECHRDPAAMKQHIDWRVDHMLDEIDATDSQRVKVNELKDDLMADGMKMHQAKREMKDDVLALWKSENPDSAQAHAMVDARIEEMRKFGHEMADAALELHKTLTPEQRKELADKVEERHGHDRGE